MKDSRIGSYGAIGLALVLAAKAAATLALCDHGLGAATASVALAHVLSRAMPVVLLYLLPYAGDLAHAKARPLAQRIGAVGLVVALATATAFAALAAQVLPGARVAAAGAAAVATGAACARWFQRRLGGFTGDTLGATQQLCELAVLLAIAAGWRA
jgi:adenosylcobinamide-GDP ribazoletransferase